MSIKKSTRFPQFLLLFLAVLTGLVAVNGDDNKELYIVYMGDRLHKESLLETHINFLSNVIESDTSPEDAIVHSYQYNFNAFTAKLTPNEAAKLASMEGVISVFPNGYHKLHTTRSWDFLGFPQTAKRNLQVESNIIVGILDTGINPDLESFDDKGFGPPPAKWKGTCEKSVNFSGCNNKLIGARWFRSNRGNLTFSKDKPDFLSPIDFDGHGTHVASTAAGNAVEGANLLGYAKGTARGAVPSARIAVYKIHWSDGWATDADTLHAFDQAIEDGVDIISISTGRGSATKYSENSIAIGSFHAMKKGIITVASAGNEGPNAQSVDNHAPWILTVGNILIDRNFGSEIALGNGKTFFGFGLNAFVPTQKLYPLVNGYDASNQTSQSGGPNFFQRVFGACTPEQLDPTKVKGNLLYCQEMEEDTENLVKDLGGIGTILEATADSVVEIVQIFMTPATVVNESVANAIKEYMNSTSSASAVIQKSVDIKVPAPYVATTSSRGPSFASKHILKPDIVAPGTNILAAYSSLNRITENKYETRYSKFNLMSGTSMACPHVSGVAAYIKSFHPEWSPAAIKSAIMTTATPLSPEFNNDAEFAYGAGLVNPVGAVDPGLVYEMNDMSYMQFLCHEGYRALGVLTNSSSVTCSTLPPAPESQDVLNYPSMELIMKTGKEPTIGVFRRKVTNVGPPSSIYNATINAAPGVEITVEPMILSFDGALQERNFTVNVKVNPTSEVTILSSSLVWNSSLQHTVRSPIVVYKADEFLAPPPPPAFTFDFDDITEDD